ncbi:MAG: TonB family protein [Elusimicrobia bacterium]|nr:TonB family protein [Elusimicrobiota bacterium]
MTRVPEASLGPYLKRSAGLHAALLCAAFLLAGRASRPAPQVYRIDFIGASPAILNRVQAPAARAQAAAAAPRALPKPERQRRADVFNLKPTFRPLPKPSFLEAAAPERRKPQPSFEPALPAERRPSPAPAAAPSAAPAHRAAGTEVAADMPNFPYPWYLTSLRQRLWQQWSENMPPGPAECQVAFTLMRDGSVVDLQVEETSGDRAFDYAALSAVRGLGPQPPLPPAFKERFLKVHVTFKAN